MIQATSTPQCKLAAMMFSGIPEYRSAMFSDEDSSPITLEENVDNPYTVNY